MFKNCKWKLAAWSICRCTNNDIAEHIFVLILCILFLLMSGTKDKDCFYVCWHKTPIQSDCLSFTILFNLWYMVGNVRFHTVKFIHSKDVFLIAILSNTWIFQSWLAFSMICDKVYIQTSMWMCRYKKKWGWPLLPPAHNIRIPYYMLLMFLSLLLKENVLKLQQGKSECGGELCDTCHHMKVSQYDTVM